MKYVKRSNRDKNRMRAVFWIKVSHFFFAGVWALVPECITVGSFTATSLNLLLQLWDLSPNSINCCVKYWSLKSQKCCQNYISLFTKTLSSHGVHCKWWTPSKSLSRTEYRPYSVWWRLAPNTEAVWLLVISSCSCSCKKLFFSFTSLRSRPFDFGLMCGFENITVKSTWFHLT